MKPWLAELLACPEHALPLALTAFETAGEEIEAGVLACAGGGGHWFPVWNGIPRMLALSDLSGPACEAFLAAHAGKLPAGGQGLSPMPAEARATVEGFQYEWDKFGNDRYNILEEKEEKDVFVDFLGRPDAWFQGKRVLEAACGPGWYAEFVRRKGAQVVAVDLSRAVDYAHGRCGPDGPAFVQGDITRLPIREGMFDYVYCYSAIQHTSDTQATLRNLVRAAKPGATVTVSHYGPIRYVRWVYDLGREFTTRIPLRVLYGLSFLAVPLSYVPGVRHVCFPSNYPRRPWRRRVLDTFDWYQARLHRYCTQGELEAWCREAGLGQVTGGLKVGIAARGTKP